MDVRQVRPTDAPLVLSLVLDDHAHLVKACDWPTRNRTARTLARTALPLGLPGRAWLAREDDTIGLLDAEPRDVVIGWDIKRLVVRGDVDKVLRPLIQAGVAHLQSKGVPRLFATCSAEVAPILQSVDFHPLARECVLLGPRGTVAGDVQLPENSRYRIPPDAWPLHQLDTEITPSLVRLVEGATSLDWSYRGRQKSEVVVERNGRIVAWLGWGDKPHHGLLQVSMLLHPKHAELGPDLLHFAMKNLPPGVRFTARVREYASEALSAFMDAGFNVVEEETLLVKHAGVEQARVAKSALRAISVPSIQGFPVRLHVPGPRLAPPRSKVDLLRLINRDRIA